MHIRPLHLVFSLNNLFKNVKTVETLLRQSFINSEIAPTSNIS